MSRYIIERIAKQPNLRRIKDTKKNRYLKKSFGVDVWTAEEAEAVLKERAK